MSSNKVTHDLAVECQPMSCQICVYIFHKLSVDLLFIDYICPLLEDRHVDQDLCRIVLCSHTLILSQDL